MDLVLAISVVAVHSRPCCYGWPGGLITAASRPIALGLDAWPEFAMRLPNSAAPLLVLFIGLPAAFSLFSSKNQPTGIPYLMNNHRVGLLSASLILSTILAVSASEIDLSKLDVKTLTKMTPLKATTPAQWRVVWTGDASREATISWTTAEPGKKHVVYYGPESGGKDGELALSQECQSNGVYSINSPSRRRNRTGVSSRPDQNEAEYALLFRHGKRR